LSDTELESFRDSETNGPDLSLESILLSIAPSGGLSSIVSLVVSSGSKSAIENCESLESGLSTESFETDTTSKSC
jgi:hypothetical protein